MFKNVSTVANMVQLVSEAHIRFAPCVCFCQLLANKVRQSMCGHLIAFFAPDNKELWKESTKKFNNIFYVKFVPELCPLVRSLQCLGKATLCLIAFM